MLIEWPLSHRCCHCGELKAFSPAEYYDTTAIWGVCDYLQEGEQVKTLYVNIKNHIANYVIYFNPIDEPGLYVSRLFIIFEDKIIPTKTAVKSKSLEAIRANLPPGLVRFDRDPNDEPQIVEIWM